ncbi:MAG: GNAT family N-acetyltransferase [Clostridia bacterium]|nr:GNAT family N-acetyltransferase [Clostridia bacterium]
MNYRKIKESEAKDFANLSATAFFFNAENAYQDIEKGGFLTETIRVLEDETGRFPVGLRLFELQMYLNSSYVKTGGIGDVSSYPENRRKGYISRLFDYTLREMYEDNYVMSYLYPFSHPFYRNYGYELCRKNTTVTMNPEKISYCYFDLEAREHIPGTKEDLSKDIMAIYTSYAEGMNFMVQRQGWFWDRVLQENPFTSSSRMYVLYQEDGTPCAYFKYIYEKFEVYFSKIKILDMAFIDRESFDMIMRFIYRLAPSTKEVRFSLPPAIEPYGISDDAWNVGMRSEPGGMMRIMNAEKALSTIKTEAENMNISIQIADDNIQENCGVFDLDVEDGTITAKKTSNKVPDMECSVQVLNQLVSGYACIDEVAHRKDIKVISKHKELNKVFAKRPIHLQDHF